MNSRSLKPYSPGKTVFLALFLFILHATAYSQNRNFFDACFANFKDKFPIESVYLHLDKYECLAGDSIWWKGYVFDGTAKSTISTTLYVELYSENGQLVSRKQSPIIESMSAGQMEVPDSIQTGRYFLRAYTTYQSNFDSGLFTAPVTVYNDRDPREVCIPERLDPDPEPRMTVRDNLEWVSSVNDHVLYCLLEADSVNKYLDKTLRVVVMSYHRPYCDATLTLTKKNLWRDFTLPCQALSGYVDLLLWADSDLIARQTLFVPQQQMPAVTFTPDTLDNRPNGYNSWKLRIDDSLLYNCSVSVTDADRTEPAPLDIEHAVVPDPLDYRNLLKGEFPVIKYQDSAFLHWTGIATKGSGKPLRKAELVALITKDHSDFTDTRLVRVDEGGHFTINGLLFFDTAKMHFQLNHSYSEVGNIHLTFNGIACHPGFALPLNDKWADSVVDTDWLTRYSVKSPAAFTKAKVLDTVVVKRRPDIREEMDHTYTTGIFSEPTLFSFDLRTETRYHELEGYLRANIPGFECNPPADTPSWKRRPVIFYVDEQLYSWDDLKGFRLADMAYIKAFLGQHWFGDSPFLRWKTGYKGAMLKPAGPSAEPKTLKMPVDEDPLVVCLYLRKGDDVRTGLPDLSSVTLKGYSTIVPFQGAGSNGWTLFWDPLVRNNEFRVRFRNNAISKRFRVCVEGVNGKGKVVRYEKMVTVSIN
jgi:hypothetical protein